jgi:DNA-binding NarL/FixJ family response regulator
MKPIRILLVDDHTLVRAGFRSLLEDLAEVRIIAEAENGREALGLVAQHRPDVVLMDITMPGLNGLEAVARIKQDFPRVRVIILSMHAGEEYVLRALRVGATGYLLKDANIEELERALQVVGRDEIYLSPAIAKLVVTGYMRCANGETSSLEQLTPRQREILQLIAEGRTSKEISQILGVSLKTVETHRAELMARLDIHDIAGLVRYAIRVGLISPDG